MIVGRKIMIVNNIIVSFINISYALWEKLEVILENIPSTISFVEKKSEMNIFLQEGEDF